MGTFHRQQELITSFTSKCFFASSIIKKTSFPFGNDVWTLCVVCFLPSLFSVRYVNRISFGSIFVSYLNLFQIISIIIFGFSFSVLYFCGNVYWYNRVIHIENVLHVGLSAVVSVQPNLNCM